MKTSYRKIEPRVINYRDYKSFSNEGFRESLLENLKGKLSGNSDQSFSNFINTCNTVLDKQLPKKKKYVRGNQSPFMNKTLSKAIMLRTNLRNKFFKNSEKKNKWRKKTKLPETNKPLCFFSKENEKSIIVI